MVSPTADAAGPQPGRAARILRIPWVLRLASSCLGSVIAGIVVGGLGSRLVMRISALAAGEPALGLVTDNGNVVGAITGEGTLALLSFVGLVAGLASGLFLAVLRTLLPARFLPLSVSVTLLALAGPIVLDPSNRDFTLLGHRALNVAMFAGLFPAFGSLAVWVAERFDGWLVRPPLGRLAPLTVVGAGIGGLIGLPGTLVLTGNAGPLDAAAIALAVTTGGIAAAASGRIASVARIAGVSALAVSTLLGLLRLVDDVATILR